MKKNIAIGFAALALMAAACSTRAEMVKIGVAVDYTLASMSEVNKQLDQGTNVTKAGSGITGMLNVDIVLARFLTVGARTGYLYCMPASATYNYLLYKQQTTVNGSLIPIEGGVNVNIELPVAPVSLTAGIYGGYGFAFASYKK